MEPPGKPPFPRISRRATRASWSTEQQCVAIFLGAFAAAIALSVAATKVQSTGVFANPRPLAALATPSRSPDDYLDYFRGSVSGYAIYHNLGHAADPLQRADVLFLGNSRLLFAFRNRDLLDHFFTARSLNYYVMGFGYGEQSAFPEALIEKYDLHPKWVIVNADPFFGGPPSWMAKTIMSGSRFDALKFQGETLAAFYSQHYLHRIVPYLGSMWWINPEGDWIWYRSRQNGTILLAAKEGIPSPALPGANAYGSLWEPARVPGAKRFLRQITRRGAKLVLTRIPPDSDVSAKGFAKVLHVPLIAPRLAGLQTLDGNHLDNASATRFVGAFLKEFGRLIDHPGR